MIASVVAALVAGSVLPAAATTPGRNGRIAFVVARPHHEWRLLTVRPDGSHQRLMAEMWTILTPDWSPDGRRIAFCGHTRVGRDDIFIVRSDGTGRRRLTDYTGSDCTPAWSPDGEWIAFNRTLPGAKRVLAIRPDGTGLHLLVGNASDVQYSPDGEWIAFTRVQDEHQAVFVRRVAGGLAHRITPLSLRAVQPDWSPSGARIAVLAPYYPFGLSNVYTVDPDGSDLEQVTHVKHVFFGIRDMSWSPNGRRMVLQLDYDIVTIRAGGGGARHVVAGEGPYQIRKIQPDWASRVP